MSIIQELTKNVLKVRYESLDDDTVENAKLRVIDVIGCAISGANAAGCKKIVDLVKEWGGKEESSILIYGTKIPAHNAAMVNSIMCRSYDFEPVEACVAGKNIPSHISGSTIQ
jgi:2-methylcitrate dehydratase PrpD